MTKFQVFKVFQVVLNPVCHVMMVFFLLCNDGISLSCNDDLFSFVDNDCPSLSLIMMVFLCLYNNGLSLSCNQ